MKIKPVAIVLAVLGFVAGGYVQGYFGLQGYGIISLALAAAGFAAGQYFIK